MSEPLFFNVNGRLGCTYYEAASDTMVAVLNAVLTFSIIPQNETRIFSIRCQEGYFICQATAWNGDWIGGIATPGVESTKDTYSFIRFASRGADAVLKKLGSSMSLLNYVHTNMRGDYSPTIYTLNPETQFAVIMASSGNTEPILNINGPCTYLKEITSVRSNDGRDPGNLPWTKSCVIKRTAPGSITIYGGGNGYWWGGQFAFAEFG